jgi:membrane-bound serine protease (ClpP class)
MKRILFLTCLLVQFLLFAGVPAARAQETTPFVYVLTYDGAVTPAMVEYMQRGIRYAERDGAEALIFQLNTPGGSITVMNDMVQTMRASQVPVVVYVAPAGAMAASAGTVITLAGHASAMAPETIIGAASPIDAQGQDLTQTAESKEKNALKATLDSLMEDRSPEAIQLAKDTVENATAVSATQALEVGLIDFIAVDLNDLLQKLDGFTVHLQGKEVVLNTANADVKTVQPSFIEQILQILTNPNIVFLLITIGVQAILIEISSPGGWVAGFIGVVCLALATYGLGVLPVNWFGIIFLVTAFVLFILDIKAPTHGALTAAGVGALIVGSLVLFNSPGTPQFQRVSVPLVIIVSIATAAVFFVILLIAIRAQKAPIRTGQESLVGIIGMARNDIAPRGSAQLAGELWSAELEEGEEPIQRGEKVIVVRAEGIRVFVRKAP